MQCERDEHRAPISVRPARSGTSDAGRPMIGGRCRRRKCRGAFWNSLNYKTQFQRPGQTGVAARAAYPLPESTRLARMTLADRSSVRKILTGAPKLLFVHQEEVGSITPPKLKWNSDGPA